MFVETMEIQSLDNIVIQEVWKSNLLFEGGHTLYGTAYCKDSKKKERQKQNITKNLRQVASLFRYQKTMLLSFFTKKRLLKHESLVKIEAHTFKDRRCYLGH